jgi:hypothetical protein
MHCLGDPRQTALSDLYQIIPCLVAPKFEHSALAVRAKQHNQSAIAAIKLKKYKNDWSCSNIFWLCVHIYKIIMPIGNGQSISENRWFILDIESNRVYSVKHVIRSISLYRLYYRVDFEKNTVFETIPVIIHSTLKTWTRFCLKSKIYTE